MATKVHRVKGVKGQKVVRRYNKFLPYDQLADVLRQDGEAFMEGSDLKRQTMWKAARKLSEMLGKKVVATRALLRIEGDGELEGYSFACE